MKNRSKAFESKVLRRMFRRKGNKTTEMMVAHVAYLREKRIVHKFLSEILKRRGYWA
jgi:hypothetical protein